MEIVSFALESVMTQKRHLSDGHSVSDIKIHQIHQIAMFPANFWKKTEMFYWRVFNTNSNSYISTHYEFYIETAQCLCRLLNTVLVSSGVNLTSWGEGASLALVCHPSSDGVTIKMLYGVDVLHRPASLLCWLKLSLPLLLYQLRLA